MFDWTEIKNWFGLLNKKTPSSKDIAKDRLKLVLVHDRTTVSSDLLEQLKTEILEVIAKYVEINVDEFDFQLTKNEVGDGNSLVHALVANIPIKSLKRVQTTEKPVQKTEQKEKTEDPKPKEKKVSAKTK